MAEEKGKKKAETTRSPKKSTSLKGMEETEITKLGEISNKLSDILSAIKDLTNVIKDSPLVSKPNDVTPVNPAINELSQTLRNISETISTQQSTNTVETNSNVLAEEEASRVKAQIFNTWETKLERRKDAYWNYTKNKGHNETYSKWLNNDQMVIPQYLQKKQFNNEQPEQRKLREAAVLHDFKTEIDLRGLRATQQYEKVNRLDSEMDTLFQEKCSGNAAKLLSDTWRKQVSQNEKISHRRWLKSDKWLNDYAENFKQSHINSNPYFKLEVRENATYAEVTSRPKQKSPTNQQNVRAADSQPKQQTTLNTIQTLLQQVQSQLITDAPQPQRKPTRRAQRKQTRPQTSQYNPTLGQLDNDGDDFLEESTSTETIT